MFSKYYSIWIPNFVFQSFCLLFYAVVLTNNIYKPVSKNTIVEKTHISLQTTILNLLRIGLPAVGPGRSPVLCLAVFSANLFYKQNIYYLLKTFFILVNTSNKPVSKNKDAEKETFSLQKHNLKAFCLYSLPPVGFTAPAGPARDLRSRHLSRCFLCKPFL
jgi:hypothetical protein